MSSKQLSTFTLHVSRSDRQVNGRGVLVGPACPCQHWAVLHVLAHAPLLSLPPRTGESSSGGEVPHLNGGWGRHIGGGEGTYCMLCGAPAATLCAWLTLALYSSSNTTLSQHALTQHTFLLVSFHQQYNSGRCTLCHSSSTMPRCLTKLEQSRRK